MQSSRQLLWSAPHATSFRVSTRSRAPPERPLLLSPSDGSAVLSRTLSKAPGVLSRGLPLASERLSLPLGLWRAACRLRRAEPRRGLTTSEAEEEVPAPLLAPEQPYGRVKKRPQPPRRGGARGGSDRIALDAYGLTRPPAVGLPQWGSSPEPGPPGLPPCRRDRAPFSPEVDHETTSDVSAGFPPIVPPRQAPRSVQPPPADARRSSPVVRAVHESRARPSLFRRSRPGRRSLHGSHLGLARPGGRGRPLWPLPVVPASPSG